MEQQLIIVGVIVMAVLCTAALACALLLVRGAMKTQAALTKRFADQAMAISEHELARLRIEVDAVRAAVANEPPRQIRNPGRAAQNGTTSPELDMLEGNMRV